jgi:hypothetical protein
MVGVFRSRLGLAGGHRDGGNEAQAGGTSRKSLVVEGHQLGAMIAGHQMQRVRKVEAPGMVIEGVRDARPCLNGRLGSPSRCLTARAKSMAPKP